MPDYSTHRAKRRAQERLAYVTAGVGLGLAVAGVYSTLWPMWLTGALLTVVGFVMLPEGS